jgi:predicted RNase H-like HicB family nuclease
MKQRKTSVKKFGINALVWREGNWYVARAIEVEVASQGKTAKQALESLQEALELYFENEKLPTVNIERLSDLRLETLFPTVTYA